MGCVFSFEPNEFERESLGVNSADSALTMEDEMRAL